MQFFVLSVKPWREIDSLLFFWDTLDGVSNLGENGDGNEEDADDLKEQCQPSWLFSDFFERLNCSSFFKFLIFSISNR